MVGPLLSMVVILGLLLSGLQVLESKFSNTRVVKEAQLRTPETPAKSAKKEPELPLGLEREEVIYRNIRQQALSLDAKYFQKFVNQEIWTILAEAKLGSDDVTLLAGVDGTVSLYSSSGHNSLGHGKDAGMRQAASKLFSSAKESLPQLVVADEFPLPKEGEFVFYIYGPKGTLTGKVPEFDLDSNHPLYQLLVSTNEVLTLMGRQNSTQDSQGAQ